MRKALIVGVDFYSNIGALSGCVNDAHSVKSVLERHADGTVNFAKPKILTSTGPQDTVGRSILKEAVRELFADDSEIALLFFAGHGYIEDTGGYLCASDCATGDDGLPMSELMSIASSSKSKNKMIVLDSCHSGVAGSTGDAPTVASVKEGMTILTASTAEQYASETPGGGSGVFTNLFVDALSGAAANLVGDITPGSIYAHIDQSLGPWSQRPVFKTNVKTFVSLRRAAPPISLADLQALTTHFPRADYEFQLDPSYEPERSQEQRDDPAIPEPDANNTATFAVLQRYARINLVRPIGAPHMYHAAMESKSCELTVLGEHYRRLVSEDLI